MGDTFWLRDAAIDAFMLSAIDDGVLVVYLRSGQVIRIDEGSRVKAQRLYDLLLKQVDPTRG